jgi:hypothetical protein
MCEVKEKCCNKKRVRKPIWKGWERNKAERSNRGKDIKEIKRKWGGD